MCLVLEQQSSSVAHLPLYFEGVPKEKWQEVAALSALTLAQLQFTSVALTIVLFSSFSFTSESKGRKEGMRWRQADFHGEL